MHPSQFRGLKPAYGHRLFGIAILAFFGVVAPVTLSAQLPNSRLFQLPTQGQPPQSARPAETPEYCLDPENVALPECASVAREPGSEQAYPRVPDDQRRYPLVPPNTLPQQETPESQNL